MRRIQPVHSGSRLIFRRVGDLSGAEKVLFGLAYAALTGLVLQAGYWIWKEILLLNHGWIVLIILETLLWGCAGILVLATNRRWSRKLGSPGAILSEATPRPGNPGNGIPPDPSPGIGTDPYKECGISAQLGHEIKNYLCTLKGNTRLLRQGCSDGGRGIIIDRIDRVVEKLEAFTRDLGTGNGAWSPTLAGAVLVHETARECARTHFHPHLERFGWDAEEELPPALGDRGRLEQVFLNLYANALEAGAERLETRIRRREGSLLVSVEDDGPGCPPEVLDRIFEPCFSTKGSGEGHGLGMFIVHSILKCHGGSIKAFSKNVLGDGSHGMIFLLDLPVFPVAAPARKAA